jgi:ubiquinone/menaquinone biosynthesis C-methylase UbiE
MTENEKISHELICPVWLAGILNNPLRTLFQNPEKILAGLVKPGQTVLDLGCGPGYFSLAMARMVGEKGRVISVDVQQKMLDLVRRQAEQQGLVQRISLHQGTQSQVGLETSVDFALLFWMAHEVGNLESILAELYRLFKPGGRLLLAEPRMHVTTKKFDLEVSRVKNAGFKPIGERKVAISRAILFQK